MIIEELLGDYSITGHNQDAVKSPYNGKLNLSLDHFKRVKAEWSINDEQTQWGLGHFKDQTLVLNFHYIGDNGLVFNGVVVYKCLSKDVLEGFWYEEYGDPEQLGYEQCLKTKITTFH